MMQLRASVDPVKAVQRSSIPSVPENGDAANAAIPRQPRPRPAGGPQTEGRVEAAVIHEADGVCFLFPLRSISFPVLGAVIHEANGASLASDFIPCSGLHMSGCN